MTATTIDVYQGVTYRNEAFVAPLGASAIVRADHANDAIIGGNGDDVIGRNFHQIGSFDAITALQDVIWSSGGNDIVFGDLQGPLEGDNWARVGEKILAGTGDDVVNGEAGVESDGATDTAIASTSYGSAGRVGTWDLSSDVVDGGDDTIHGQVGHDIWHDTMFGGDGFLWSGNEGDSVHGGIGNDYFVASDGSDSGHHHLSGNGGPDTFFGPTTSSAGDLLFHA